MPLFCVYYVIGFDEVPKKYPKKIGYRSVGDKRIHKNKFNFQQ